MFMSTVRVYFPLFGGGTEHCPVHNLKKNFFWGKVKGDEQQKATKNNKTCYRSEHMCMHARAIQRSTYRGVESIASCGDDCSKTTFPYDIAVKWRTEKRQMIKNRGQHHNMERSSGDCPRGTRSPHAFLPPIIQRVIDDLLRCDQPLVFFFFVPMRCCRESRLCSVPWSKSSPRGPEVPVLLACFPSMASKDWYTNNPIPKLWERDQGAVKAYKVS